MKSYFLLIILLSISGCVTQDEGKLDIEQPLEEVNGNDLDNESKKIDTNLIVEKKVSVDSVVRWQNFFQKSPNLQEKKILEQKLQRWGQGDSIDLLIEKGRLEMQLGRIKFAEASFREALRKDPQNIESLLELSMLYFRTESLELGFTYLAKIRQEITALEKPDKGLIFKFRYILGLSYIARGEMDEGRRILSDLIAKDKTFIHAYVALASSYIKSNKLDAAEFIAKRGLDQGIESPNIYNLLGVVAEKRGYFEQASQWYTKAIDVQPSFASALVNRANLSIQQSLYEEAEDDIARALIYDENHVEALIANGIIKKKLGQFELAKVSFNKALDIKSDNPVARFNLAVLMLNVYERHSEAIRLFQEVVLSTKDNDELKTTAENYINDIKEMRESF